MTRENTVLRLAEGNAGLQIQDPGREDDRSNPGLCSRSCQSYDDAAVRYAIPIWVTPRPAGLRSTDSHLMDQIGLNPHKSGQQRSRKQQM